MCTEALEGNLSLSHPLFVDEGVDLCHGDDLGHEAAQPLRVQEEEIVELALHVGVVEQNPTFVEEADRLKKRDSVTIQLLFGGIMYIAALNFHGLAYPYFLFLVNV